MNNYRVNGKKLRIYERLKENTDYYENLVKEGDYVLHMAGDSFSSCRIRKVCKLTEDNTQKTVLGFEMLNRQYTTINKHMMLVTSDFVQLHKQLLTPLDS